MTVEEILLPLLKKVEEGHVLVITGVIQDSTIPFHYEVMPWKMFQMKNIDKERYLFNRRVAQQSVEYHPFRFWDGTYVEGFPTLATMPFEFLVKKQIVKKMMELKKDCYQFETGDKG